MIHEEFLAEARNGQTQPDRLLGEYIPQYTQVTIYALLMLHIPSVLLDTVENRTMQGEIGIDTEITPGIFYGLFDYMNERELLPA